jgi:type II secretory pathway component PulM
VKRWFLGLGAAGQVAVVVLGTAGIAGLMLVITLPQHTAQARMRQSLAVAEASLLEARALSNRYQTLASSTGNETESGGLSALVNSSLAGLPVQPARIQQNGAGALQVGFDNVDFNSLLPWLYALENIQAVNLEVATLTQGANGTANVSVVLGLRQP